MKKLVAFLLTLTLLISMVGTVSLAADETKGTTFPKETVSVDAKGNVSVTLPGVENFVEGTAWVYPKDAKEGTFPTVVDLTFDKKTVAFVGTDASVAGGMVTGFYLSYENPKQGIDAKNYVAVDNEAYYWYYSSGDNKGKISSAHVYMKKTYYTKNSEGKFVKSRYDNNEKTFETDDYTGLIIEDKEVTEVKTVGAKGNWKDYTKTVTEKDYDSSFSGRYLGKTVEETKKTYDLDYVQTAQTYSKKEYNEDDKLTFDETDKTTITYSADKAYETTKTNSESKSLSTKGLTIATAKGNSTETRIYVKDNGYQKQTNTSEAKVFDRNGKLAEAYTTAETWKDDKTQQAGTYTTKYYNTYTGALTDDYLTTELRINGKMVSQTNRIKNNDDGSLRFKVVRTAAETGKKDKYGDPIEEYTVTRYNKDNKVVAKQDKDGTWTDGNGKILGWNVVKTSGEYYRTNVYFKQRTGEISYYTTENSVIKNGIETTKWSTFENGKETANKLRVETLDPDSYEPKAYAEYENGVLSKVFAKDTNKDGVTVRETKNYDLKGTLAYSVKEETKGNNEKITKYDHRGKMTRIEETKNKWTPDEVTTVMKVDPDTQIMTESSKKFDKYNKAKDYTETITQYFNNVNELIYTTTNTKENNITDVVIYADAAGKEFARTYNAHNPTYTVRDEQEIINKNYPTVKALDAELERTVTKVTFEGKDTTTTKDYTKWWVTGGVKGAEKTRKEVVKQIVKDAYNQTTVTKDGVLTKDTVVEKNDYDDNVKTTVTYYDWYTGKQSSKNKTFKSGVPFDPWTYTKQYDQYNNLQTYSETDNTDKWDWKHTYYSNGALKQDKWTDKLDYDSSYEANFYRDGIVDSKETWNNGTGNIVEYNRDGSWYEWTDVVNGVANTWEYDTKGTLTGYTWNHKDDVIWNYDNNTIIGEVESWDYYDAAGNLIYSEKVESNLAGGAPDNDGTPKGVTVKTRTDPAGNTWTVTDGKNVTLTLKKGGSGWQSAVGKWFYIENGKPVQSAWKKIDGSWYYFNADGSMAQGIVTEEKKNLAAGDKVLDKAYALDAKTGALVVGGWVSVGDGRNTAWAFTDANGEVVTGWKQIGGKWYYFEEGWDNGHYDSEYTSEATWTQSGIRGKMVSGGAAKVWNADGTQHTYFFNKDGSWDNSPGWKCAEGVEVGTYNEQSATSDTYRTPLKGIEWHYYDKNGNEAKGWNLIDGEWYYFNEDGVMRNGWVKSGNNWYFMDRADGALATNGWVEDVYEGWYYMDKNGQYQTGWLKDGDTWYYLKQDGAMAENEWAKYGNNWYYMGSDGQIETGWVQDKGSWYYLKQDGAMKTGWEGSGNTWYYLGDDGAMLTNTDKTIDGKVYHFDENGLCTNP